VLIVSRGGPAAPSLRVPVPLVLDRQAATPVLRVFAADDVRHGSVERVASAVGEGSIAATQVTQHVQIPARRPLQTIMECQVGSQALAFCAAHGRTTRDQCIGRFLSHDAADYKYICFPPAGSQVQGCYLSSNARKS